MKLAKTLLLGTAAGFAAMAGAQAADLPSRKAAPVNYVKICDAYGAGFFYIPGTDTCLKVGGYVRVQYDYVPGKAVMQVTGAAGTLGTPAGTLAGTFNTTQVAGAMDTTGTEVRGRVDLDARTPTSMGTVRTFIRLRAANTSGLRNTTGANNANYTMGTASATAITIESAFVQWAGFTFGVAPENYAMIPGITYSGNTWAGFPNGIKQLAYTATFGGGFSATLAIEDRTEFTPAGQIYNHSPVNGYQLVGNIRVDQSWGFAAVHAMVGQNSLRSDFATAGGAFAPPSLGGLATSSGATTPLLGSTGKMGWAIGATAKINLPMIAAGDALWLTANYADGAIGAIGINLASISQPANRRMVGGILRFDTPLVVTSGNGTVANPFTIGNTKAWNVGALFTHYWAPQWRSNFVASYAEYNPPAVSAAATTASPFQWGKGSVMALTGSIIYSPVKDFDIGLELQYASVKNTIQNLGLPAAAAFVAAGKPGLSSNNFSLKARVERQF